MHPYYFDSQQQQFYAQPAFNEQQMFHPHLNLEVEYNTAQLDNSGFDQQPQSAMSSASPPTPHGALEYARVGYGFHPQQQRPPAHDPYPPLYPPPALGSSEHAFFYQPTDEPFYSAYQPQSFKPPSPAASSSSLWQALELPGVAASNPDPPAPGPVSIAPIAHHHAKAHLAPLRIATPRQQQLPGSLDSPLTPSSPEPFFTESPIRERIQWQVPQAPGQSQATGKAPRSGPARTPMKRASSGDRKPIMACLFCRGRKIACGGPLHPESDNKTCNQCARRNIKCCYPVESHRGLRRGGKKCDDPVPAHEVPVFTVAPLLASAPP